MVSQTGNSIRESWGESDSFAQIEGISGMGKWFYRELVGIAPDLHRPAFAHFFLRPILPRQVGSVEFQYESPRGLIRSQMVRQGNRLRWTVVVPPNATATISFPSGRINEITDSGKAVLEGLGVSPGGNSDRGPSVKVSSGNHQFELTL